MQLQFSAGCTKAAFCFRGNLQVCIRLVAKSVGRAAVQDRPQRGKLRTILLVTSDCDCTVLYYYGIIVRLEERKDTFLKSSNIGLYPDRVLVFSI